MTAASQTTPDISLTSGDFWGDDPHPALAWLRANDPVHWDGEVWGITRYGDLKYVETHPDPFSSAHGIRHDAPALPMMISMDDPEHKLRRKLVNKGFTPRRVRDQQPYLTQVVDRLIDDALERGRFDFVGDFAAWIPLAMIGDALGFSEDDHPDLLTWSDDLMKGQGASDEQSILDMTAAFESYLSYIVPVVQDRRRNPREDLISVLAHAEVDGHSLSDDDIIQESLLILIGGDETTRHVISGGAYQLLSDRSRWERIQADRSLLPGAVEESLRWVSPIKNMARTALRDTELGGKTIREGDKLLLLYPSANRDEDVFDDPFAFDIERSPNDHVAFGFGTHFCLGASLARLELTVAFERLLHRVPDLALLDEGEPVNRPANFVSGYEEMPVTVS